MSVLKKNILANFGGNIWTGLMTLVFLPLYIRFLGIEAYGLTGIFTTLLVIFSLLDMGLSSTLNRELARLAVQENKAQDMRDLVRTLEIPYWFIGIFIAVTLVFASPLITYHWVKVETLPLSTVRTAIMLMGLCVAFQWPIGFYSGGLMGLEKLVLLNGINIVVATFRGLGTVLILWLVSPTIEAFFLWQLAVSTINTGTIVFFLWRSLPGTSKTPCFRRDLLRNVWRFAAGMTAISLVTTLLTQLDKVILSRMLSLEMFGYYTLANVVAMTLLRVIGPIFTAIYPQFTRLVQLGKNEEIKNLYHKSAQFVSVLILPASLVIALFSKEILLLWTRSHVTVDNTHLLVSILVMGTAFNSLMNMPYALQLAHGWTRLTFIVNSISVVLLVPLMILLTKEYGAVGAALVWLLLNTGYLFTNIQIMHRRLLITEKWKWYFIDTGIPFVVALLVAGTFRLILTMPVHNLLIGVYVVAIFALTFVAAALTTPVTRDLLQRKILKRVLQNAVKS